MDVVTCGDPTLAQTWIVDHITGYCEGLHTV